MSNWISSPGPASPCAIIAEIAQAHDGSLGTAHAMIDAAAGAGVDAVKFQTHIAAAESSPHEPWRKKFSPQDDTRFDYWKRMEFSAEQWHGLKRHAAEKNLAFMSSPFSNEAVELLQQVGVAAWKVASGEINNLPMIERICSDGKPVILSTGMSEWDEIAASIDFVKARNIPVCVLQCTTSYPTSPEEAGVNLLPEFAAAFSIATGLSDHSASIFPSLIAAWLGAQVLEVHLTLTRRAFGPDVAASLDVEEMAELVRGVRYVEKMRDNPVDKHQLGADIVGMRNIFMKSLVLLRDMRAGEIITADDLAARKPGTGIGANRYQDIIGRKLARDTAAMMPLQEEDII